MSTPVVLYVAVPSPADGPRAERVRLRQSKALSRFVAEHGLKVIDHFEDAVPPS